MKAVLASQNRHKLEELREALPGWELEALDADAYPEETGETYYENALIKARFGREHADPHAWVLGEDSGIEAVALGGGSRRSSVTIPGYPPRGWNTSGPA